MFLAESFHGVRMMQRMRRWEGGRWEETEDLMKKKRYSIAFPFSACPYIPPRTVLWDPPTRTAIPRTYQYNGRSHRTDRSIRPTSDDWRSLGSAPKTGWGLSTAAPVPRLLLHCMLSPIHVLLTPLLLVMVAWSHAVSTTVQLPVIFFPHLPATHEGFFTSVWGKGREDLRNKFSHSMDHRS